MKDLWGVLCMFWDAKYSSSRERKLFINYYIYWEEIAQGPAKDPVLNICGPRYNPYQSLNYDDTRWLAQLCFEIIRICHCLCVCMSHYSGSSGGNTQSRCGTVWWNNLIHPRQEIIVSQLQIVWINRQYSCCYPLHTTMYINLSMASLWRNVDTQRDDKVPAV